MTRRLVHLNAGATAAFVATWTERVGVATGDVWGGVVRIVVGDADVMDTVGAGDDATRACALLHAASVATAASAAAVIPTRCIRLA